MTTNLTRRGILKALGIGGLALAAEPILEPARKLWFVSSNAPVGSRIERIPEVQYFDNGKQVSRDELLRRLWTRVKSQEDLDLVRDTSRIVDTCFTYSERNKLMTEYVDGLKAQGRYRGSPFWKELGDDYDLPPSAIVKLGLPDNWCTPCGASEDYGT